MERHRVISVVGRPPNDTDAPQGGVFVMELLEPLA